MFRSTYRSRAVAASLGIAMVVASAAQPSVLITEIHYHPVEEPAFNADGSPVLDLYEDVHEFLELHNPGTSPISLEGWELAGGISYRFPPTAIIHPMQFLVVAKNPARLTAIPEYALSAASVLGPYDGQLGNASDTIRLRDASNEPVDSVSYSAAFPWAISADALGAGPDFTGLNPLNYQYRGRSLERVSLTHPANDPANWLASPLPGNPSPGRPNTISRAVPKPVAVHFSVQQEADEASMIRGGQPVRITVRFSGPAANVHVEWFVDDVNQAAEPRTLTPLSPEGQPADAQFATVLPGHPEQSVVRYRFLANRGDGLEVVSPRSDDPYPWHAYYVNPVRTSTYPVYEVFVSAASLQTLNNNISQNPRRVTWPDPPGYPRESWNATEPAIFIHEGTVYDMRMRHHGSRYNRSAGRNSLKFQFPRYQLFNGYQGVFETDKGNDFVVAHGLFLAAGLPTSKVRYVDLYLNGNLMRRLEQEEMDDRLLKRYYAEQRLQNPGLPPEAPGEFYKSTGCIEALNPYGEGPYAIGDERRLGPWSIWTPLDRYTWTYTIQSAEWKQGFYLQQMIEGLWQARGDTHTAPNPNIPALRTFLEQHFDVDKSLAYLAIINWMCPWDDTTQNHFLWQQRNGRWSMLPWDFDAMFGNGDNTPPGASIYMGEVGDPNNNFRGPNFLKDSFFKAFRQEYKQKLFLLNNTLLHPSNIRAMGFGSIGSFADARFASVNAQCGLGIFQRPTQPVNLLPSHNITALPPMDLQGSPYEHSSTPAPAHAHTTWEIRTADGSYQSPVFKLTTATSLTMLPLPFESLEFGRTYFWRCTYTDSDLHPSLPSAETSFNFGPAPSVVTLVGFDAATSWRYDQSGAEPSGWNEPDFNANAWPAGVPLFYVETSALPEPKRTPLTLGRTTYYFRTEFDFQHDPTDVALRLHHIVDDGLVVYLNGSPIWRSRMPEEGVNYDTYALEIVGDAVAEGPFLIHTPHLVRGRNVLAAEVHQSGPNSSDIVFGLALEATVPAVSGGLLINEIGAVNRTSVPWGGSHPDWIEIFNAGSQAVDLGDMSLSDDVLRPDRYLFPPGTILAAQDYLTVWCDNATNTPGLHTGFGLSAEGQSIILISRDSSGILIQDTITFGLQIPDLTIGRYPPGSDSWTLTIPTPNAPNLPQSLSPPHSLLLNEWMASPNTGDDWLELYNPEPLPVALDGLFLTDDPALPLKSRILPLSFIPAEGFVKLVADENPQNGANHLNFKISASGETLALFAQNGTTLIDQVRFGAQSAGTSQGRLPDGAPTWQFFPTTHSPGQSNYLPIEDIVISEVLTHSDPPLEDAIELHNISAHPVDVSGWYLSDSRDHLRKYRIPPGTVIAAGQFRVFYEYQFNPDTSSTSSFSLSSARGDEVHLSTAALDGTLLGYRTFAEFGPAANGVTFGRYPTTIGVDFPAMSQRTLGADQPLTLDEFRTGPGLPNSPPKVGPVVISEIQYHPPELGTNDNTRDEFIELLNTSSAPVPLYDPAHPENTWRLNDAVSFRFPPETLLAPGQTLLIVSFDPLIDAAASLEFRAAYALNGAVVLLGPYAGKLDNSSENLELLQPDSPQLAGPDAGLVPYLVVDRVKYGDSLPWPPAADGSGLSLQRIDTAAYGNDPANWQADLPTPGRSTSDTALQLQIVDYGENLAALQFSALADRSYSLQYRTSMTEGDWLLLEFIPARSTNAVIVFTDHPLAATRFYRISSP